MSAQHVSFGSYSVIERSPSPGRNEKGQPRFGAVHPDILERDNDTLTQDNAWLLRENTEAGTQLARSSREASGLQQRNHVLEDEMQSAHRLVGACREERAVLLRERETLASQNKAIFDRLSKVENLLKGRDDQVARKDSELRAVQKDALALRFVERDLSRKLESRDERIQALERRVAELCTTEDMTTAYPEDWPSPLHAVTEFELRGDVRQRLKFLESVNESLRADNGSLKSVVEDLQRSLTALRGVKMRDADAIDLLGKECDDERAARLRVEADHAAKAQLLDEMRQEARREQAKMEELEEALAAAEARAELSGELEEQLRESIAADAELRLRLEERDREVTRFGKQLLDERDRAAGLQRELDAIGGTGSSAAKRWQGEADYLSGRLKELQLQHARELQALRDQLSGLAPPSPRRGFGDAEAAEMEARLAAQQVVLEQKQAATDEAEGRCRKLECELEAERMRAASAAERAGELLRDANRRAAALRDQLMLTRAQGAADAPSLSVSPQDDNREGVWAPAPRRQSEGGSWSAASHSPVTVHPSPRSDKTFASVVLPALPSGAWPAEPPTAVDGTVSATMLTSAAGGSPSARGRPGRGWQWSAVGATLQPDGEARTLSTAPPRGSNGPNTPAAASGVDWLRRKEADLAQREADCAQRAAAVAAREAELEEVWVAEVTAKEALRGALSTAEAELAQQRDAADERTEALRAELDAARASEAALRDEAGELRRQAAGAALQQRAPPAAPADAAGAHGRAGWRGRLLTAALGVAAAEAGALAAAAAGGIDLCAALCAVGYV
eukprot:TRINITY_DN2097_c1_g2_i1.p1 TRINITY_DN2097_c1_g2~~TRINITY_DN2097_c1_g2_i1.p1  ORF type:complete len:818 (+),score=345.92 TRINITY_DN2097_c1_g2_i1:67-2454(+)